MTVTYTLPIKTVAGSNVREHWRVRYKRVANERSSARLMTPNHPLPCVVTVTRLSAGSLDAHDNLPNSVKGIVDGIADKLGVPDNDPRIQWRYAQEKCKRGMFGVRVVIEGVVEPTGERK